MDLVGNKIIRNSQFDFEFFLRGQSSTGGLSDLFLSELLTFRKMK